jgi:transcriptional regulator with XRE-family HTH domain
MTKTKIHARPIKIELVRQPVPGRKRRRTPVDSFVGQRLKQARLLAGLSQSELGSRVGVSFQAIQKYESGENRLSASRLLAVAEFLGKPVSFFFNELTAAGANSDQGSMTPKEIKLLRYYRGIAREDVRDRLLKLVKCMSESAVAEPDAEFDDASD